MVRRVSLLARQLVDAAQGMVLADWLLFSDDLLLCGACALFVGESERADEGQIYFAILLVHRARRDDHACRVKCARTSRTFLARADLFARRYGEDWKRYCSRVPARIIKVLY